MCAGNAHERLGVRNTAEIENEIRRKLVLPKAWLEIPQCQRHSRPFQVFRALQLRIPAAFLIARLRLPFIIFPFSFLPFFFAGCLLSLRVTCHFRSVEL